jgi:hypothetical protein
MATENPHGKSPCTITFQTDIGASVTVTTTVDEVHDLQRTLGRAGWSSITLPPGGLYLPLELEPHFDWSLLGARKATFGDEVRVLFQGFWYTRRELEERAPSRKLPHGMPRAVRYSRGARPSEDDTVAENSEGGIRMVSLVTFKGPGSIAHKRHLLTPAARAELENGDVY